MTLIPRPCPICGSSHSSRVVAESNVRFEQLDAYAFASRKSPEMMHHRLLLCSDCDLLYASPMPDEGILAAGYRDAAYDSGEEARCAALTYAKALAGYLPSLPDRQSALDVGAGDGAFLAELLRMSFSVVRGIEPSAAPIQSAPPEIRPLLRQEMFGEAAAAPGSLSLLTCFQTLEHLSDPMGFARTAFKLLKPGGVICLVTHDRRSLINRMLGTKSPIYDVEHLQLFTGRSAQKLLSECGLVKLCSVSLANTYPLYYWLRLFPFPRRIKDPLVRAGKAHAWGRLPLSLRVGNMMTLGYRPLDGR